MLLVLGLEASCGMIRTHFISIPWMLWTLQKQKQYRASHPCQSLQHYPVQAWPPTLCYNSPHMYHLSQTELKTLAQTKGVLSIWTPKYLVWDQPITGSDFFFFFKFGHWIRKSLCTIPHSPATPRQEQAVYAQKYRSEEIIYTNLKFKEDQSSIFS